jgi:hypothetical protein
MDAGVYVPLTATRNGHPPHHNFAYEVMDMPGFRPERGTLEEMYAELSDVDAPSVLISTESLCGKPEYRPKYDRIRKLCDALDRRLVVVIYLRDQLSYINSLYAFGIWRLTHAQPFEEYVRRTVKHPRFYFTRVVDPWAKTADELVVRPFGADVIDSFFDPLGVKISDPVNENTGVGPKTVEALRTLIDPFNAFCMQHGVRTRGRALTNDLAKIRAIGDEAGWNSQKFWGFSPALAAETLSHFARDNESLLATYGVQLPLVPPKKSPNAFSPGSAPDGERREFECVRDKIWGQLTDRHRRQLQF